MTRYKSHANRGKPLERLIEIANTKYKRQGTAKIDKTNPPVKVLNMNGKYIDKAFYEKKATVDYIGSYKGYSIAFDAKSTNVETRFDLKNVEEHQYKTLEEYDMTGAITFLLVEFKTLDEIYILPFDILQDYWRGAKTGGRKSIPHEEFEDNCYYVDDIMSYLDYVEGRVTDES